MRIITGRYKGRHFDIPRSFKARPTTDFAKENVFNVLTQYIDFEGTEALDLFSGTGSITLELLSRGCSRVVSVELDRDHIVSSNNVCRSFRETMIIVPLGRRTLATNGTQECSMFNVSAVMCSAISDRASRSMISSSPIPHTP